MSDSISTKNNIYSLLDEFIGMVRYDEPDLAAYFESNLARYTMILLLDREFFLYGEYHKYHLSIDGSMYSDYP